MFESTWLPHISRNIVLCTFAFIALLTLLHLYNWTPSILYRMSVPTPFRAQHPTEPQQIPHNSDAINASSPQWCESNECLRGHWVPRQPPFTSVDDFRAAYANAHHPVWETCSPIPDASSGSWTEEEKLKAGQDRLVDVMGWTWMPDVGIMREWDAEEFVVRLLRSPGGLIVIGDSISQQHFHTLGYTLNQADITFDVNFPNLPLFDHKNVQQFVLKKGTPMTQHLFERAGVPASRLERPVATMLEDHMLIGEHDIREITRSLGAPREYPWLHDFQRVEGWEEFVKNASQPRDGEQDTVTEDTVLFMNAGAHWSRHELSMLPHRPTDKNEQSRVKESYRRMTKLITTRLAPISRLSVYYRSTSPGHPDCERSSKPYPDAPSALLAERDIVQRLTAQVDSDDAKMGRKRWDWDLFPPHNKIWRKAVERLTNERKKGARWFYADFWDQALQRPDAHDEPGVDCLHWCRPAVLNQWTYHLHHLLFMETESKRRLDELSKHEPSHQQKN